MAGLHSSDFKNPVLNWIDTRLPILSLMHKEYGAFPTPKNFNYLWNFGALATVTLVVMIATGVFLAMNYQPNVGLAFDSVQHIMRDVNYGWLIRYVHQNGASMFFIVTYIHILRGMYYGSYKKPRELLVDAGRGHPAAADGDRVHGLRAAVGADVVLGRHRHHQSVFRLPGRRARHRDAAVGRLQRRQSDAQPLLRPALSAAVHHCRGGRPARGGAAHHRLEQSARHRPQGSAGYAAVPSRITRSRTASGCAPSSWSGRRSSSSARTCSPIPTTSSPPIPCRRRPTSCRNGTSCRSTPCCARCRTSSAASASCSPRS